jgi:peptidyl-prolyl cis-trans isomerase C
MEFEHPELVRASHILIRVPEDADEKTVAEKKKAADAALERVTSKKEDFTAVAKEVSEEPGAKESGGDLNFFPKDRMVPEFANAAFAMKKGEISKEPVRTKFGWHVIQVTDRKDSGTMPYDEVKGQVGAYLEGGKRREAVRNVIDTLRAEAKVENKLPEAPAAPAPAGS